ncbi:MAG: alanine--tRNA ligase [Desulfurococcales archaeon]|nr:alanine--tRNA ligase [Desulfurococcales archaeon]
MTMPIDPREYQLDFFKEYGFVRKEGKKCKGEYFWTLNLDFEEPQDTPCVDYWFDKIPASKVLSVSDARKEFISFFEENGHTPVKPRPVVARWREDLYLTIASIVVFQPHVTSGLVPPPANPLVISQPSIRLEDIDNVGITIGRHLTTFEMAAHHAFNYPDKQVYWKEETVRLAFEFFTKRIGIPPEQIIFKESWWEGGGNAGPSFEVTVGGLELATLVFMKYKVVNGKYEEIPLKIVDTGYGVERIAWFTQKTPTAFQTIYGNLLETYRKLLGVEEPAQSILWAAFRAAGNLDPEDPVSLEAYYKRISNDTGLDIDNVKSILVKEARLYSVIDHAKTIALMLGDGIVPSNTGEGYLARLVIRRALRQLKLLGVDVSLAELVDMQVEYWGRDFPQLIENRDYIIDATRWEEKRFTETISRGEQIVKKILKTKKAITVDDLIQLYDSHGLPPEIVAELAKKRGLIVNIPHNFYSLVASRHKAPSTLKKTSEKTRLPEEIVQWASRFNPTRKVYYEDQYKRELTAKVLGVSGRFVVLDKTIFYPTGGGQLHDTGVILYNGVKYEVINVEKIGDVIVHELKEHAPIPVGAEVKCLIDWERRYRLMRHHTSTHIILGAARRVLGNHVWQAGAEKTPEKARLDITHHKPITKEQLREIEKLANMVVDSRKPIRFMELSRSDAEERYGFRIYQGGVPMTPTIRLVEIEDWDVEACGGTHLKNTGEAGAIKVISATKIQDGVIRLEYVAGTRVSEVAAELEDVIDDVSMMIKAKSQNIKARIQSILNELEKKEEALKRYREIWVNNLMSELKRKKFVIAEALDKDRRIMQEIMKKLTMEVEDGIVVFYYEVDDVNIQVEIAAGQQVATNIGKLVKEILPKYNGRGGGSKTYASARIPKQHLNNFLDEIITSTMKR